MIIPYSRDFVVTVLITGASGFIGSALIAKFQDIGQPRVRACYRAGSIPNDVDVDFSTVNCIDGLTNWGEALVGVDSIIHTAARVHIMRDSSTDPLYEFRRVNTEGTLNLARQAASVGVKRFVFVSSVKVNGGTTTIGQPFKPSDPVRPEGAYGLSKNEAEQGLRLLASKSDMEVVIVRPPLVYGYGVKANFAALARLVGGGVPLPLASVESNRRSYVSIENLLDFLLVALNHPQAANQTFLVSDGEDLSTTALIHRIAVALNRPVRLFPVPIFMLRMGANLIGKGDFADRLLGSLQVDIAKNQSLLGWVPSQSLDEGLRAALVAPENEYYC
jgi:nucleoside-diphosphate-sugar epimerase